MSLRNCSQPFELIKEGIMVCIVVLLLGVIIILLLLLSSFNNFVVIFEGYFLLQRIHHVVDIVIHDVVTLHNFGGHFIVDQDFVHFVVEELHVLSHLDCVELAHLLAHNSRHVIESVDGLLIVLHALDLLAHELHLDGRSLVIQCYVNNKSTLCPLLRC